jgi:CubicO group peptidase (beta-lactamase class C family)
MQHTSVKRKRFLLAPFFILLFVCAAFSQSSVVDSRNSLEGFDGQVEQVMSDLHVPGAAVGIIQGDRVILAKGYGVREIDTPNRVTADTIFAVASLTKSFTTTAMATLVDQGKLKWDVPVRTYLPSFQLYDPIATQLITPRDMLTHRSGLPRHDFIRVSTFLTREELVRRLQYLEPSLTFREGFQYNNLMYVAAGYMAGHIAGMSWEELVKQRLFVPLEMTSSNTSVDETQRQANFARPHVWENGSAKVTGFYNYQRFGIGPNGAVNSTVNDFLKYLQMHLNGGVFNGTQVVSKGEVSELHRPAELSDRPAELSNGMRNYALGWFVQTYHDHIVLEHGGAITGFTSQMILIPDQKIGIVVFNNLESALPHIVAWSLVDRLLGLKARDSMSESRHEEQQGESAEEQENKKMESGRLADAHPTLDLSNYVGAYFHPAYGTIYVVREGEDLAVQFDAIKLQLKHYNYDWFQIESESYKTKQLAQFRIDDHGKVTQLLLPLESRVKPFEFAKQ